MQAINSLRQRAANLSEYALSLMPYFARGKMFAAIIRAMVKPLQELSAAIKQLRTNVEYDLRHTTQICYLRARLNDAFDPVIRRIRIEETSPEAVGYVTIKLRNLDAGVLIGRQQEQNNPLRVYRRGYQGTTSANFIIVLPWRVRADNTRLNAIVTNNRLAGMQYSIDRQQAMTLILP